MSYRVDRVSDGVFALDAQPGPDGGALLDAHVRAHGVVPAAPVVAKRVAVAEAELHAEVRERAEELAPTPENTARSLQKGLR